MAMIEGKVGSSNCSFSQGSRSTQFGVLNLVQHGVRKLGHMARSHCSTIMSYQRSSKSPTASKLNFTFVFLIQAL